MAQNPTMGAISKADRISDLPCHVVDNILKCLPLQDAVRTSILSRGWRYKWTTIPDLIFDVDFIKSLRGNYEPKSIINHVLAVHKGPIVKFAILDLRIASDSIIDCWLHFLSKHHIEDLRLEILSHDVYVDKVELHRLFGFDNLRYLSVWQSIVKLPPFFEGFNRLLKLFLWLVDFELEDDFNMFISKCPMLEHLEVQGCTTPLSLVIDAPNLKIFKFEGIFKSIIFRTVNIEEISFLGYDRYFAEHGAVPEPESLGTEGNLVNVFGQLSSLRRLRSDEFFLQVLAFGVVPQKLANDLNHLTSLHFSYFEFGNMGYVRCLLCLIRSCPNLQTLVVYTVPDHYEAGIVIRHLKAEQKLEIPLSCCLENVKIIGFSGSKTHMEFVKLLLLGAVRLAELKLHFDQNPLQQDMLKELLGFSRASPKAVIILG